MGTRRKIKTRMIMKTSHLAVPCMLHLIALKSQNSAASHLFRLPLKTFEVEVQKVRLKGK